jgi:hypothetical protein
MDNAVGVVQAYLRINGYFTVAEYPIVERTESGAYRSVTDLDVLAVRFPRAREVVPHEHAHGWAPGPSFSPDPALGPFDDGIDMIIGEVKEGRAELNRAARDPEVLAAALTRFGCCGHHDVREVVQKLHNQGRATTSPGHRIRLIAFGTTPGESPDTRFQTIYLGHVLEFIRSYLHRHWEVFQHAQFKDPVLSLLMLCEKAGAGPKP